MGVLKADLLNFSCLSWRVTGAARFLEDFCEIGLSVDDLEAWSSDWAIAPIIACSALAPPAAAEPDCEPCGLVGVFRPRVT